MADARLKPAHPPLPEPCARHRAGMAVGFALEATPARRLGGEDARQPASDARFGRWSYFFSATPSSFNLAAMSEPWEAVFTALSMNRTFPSLPM